MSTQKLSKPRLKTLYTDKVRGELTERFKYSNPHLVPKMEKIVISTGLKEALKDKSVIQDAVYTLSMISGQMPVKTKARKSVSNFKLREGQELGAKVTLRGDRMWDFLDRLNAISLPATQDFQGLPKKFHKGNYAFGLSRCECFQEVDFDKVKHVIGLNIQIVTTAQTEDECYHLLNSLGVPFKK
ncbi:MAG: 50S ribosomal protein L5 [Chlamydiae bacterium]|nr:50S ribosomal protein L5 [Chlamydiota bacterium]